MGFRRCKVRLLAGIANRSLSMSSETSAQGDFLGIVAAVRTNLEAASQRFPRFNSHPYEVPSADQWSCIVLILMLALFAFTCSNVTKKGRWNILLFWDNFRFVVVSPQKSINNTQSTLPPLPPSSNLSHRREEKSVFVDHNFQRLHDNSPSGGDCCRSRSDSELAVGI